MPEFLAKVTPRTLNVPRGPDVTHRIRVPRSWFEAGEVVEFELPRNVTCAACEGGGCDACERSGAVTLRARDELAEILSVTLPLRKGQGEIRSIVIRIPEQGGFAPGDGAALPRGLLLLRVEPSSVADPTVSRVGASARPLSQRVIQSLRIPQSPRGRARLFAVAALIIVLAGLAILAFGRHRGLG